MNTTNNNNRRVPLIVDDSRGSASIMMSNTSGQISPEQQTEKSGIWGASSNLLNSIGESLALYADLSTLFEYTVDDDSSSSRHTSIIIPRWVQCSTRHCSSTQISK